MRITSEFEEHFRVTLEHVPELDGRHLRYGAEGASPRYVIPLTKASFQAASCSPPTPVSELDRYTNDIRDLDARIAQVLNGTPAGSLVMGPFAQATNALANYVNAMPDEFCIGPSNQAAFDRLNTALSNAISTIKRGNTLFEGNLERFVNQAIPLLNNVYNLASAINAASRDFTQALASAQRSTVLRISTRSISGR